MMFRTKLKLLWNRFKLRKINCTRCENYIGEHCTFGYVFPIYVAKTTTCIKFTKGDE